MTLTARRRWFGLLVGAAGCLAATSASAHDFWVQPDEFDHARDVPITISLQVGHGDDRQRSQIPRSRITRFAAVGPAGREVDLKDALDLGGVASDGAFRLPEEGVHVLVLETDHHALSALPAGRFNRYLEEEGLRPAIELRYRTGRANDGGTEKYGRCAKSIILVRAADPEAETHISRPVGLTLEIVAEANPYSLPSGSPLPIRLYYLGAPLAGALVKLTNLEDDAAPMSSQRTDSSGRTAFAIPHHGTWLLNVVWTRPLPPGSEADFETTFSSLSFAVQSD